ncbi:MAG: hypothetical protein GX815_02600 [Clostridiales bacterium]|nr:hypothetical protein [Clostridiales bacterium]
MHFYKNGVEKYNYRFRVQEELGPWCAKRIIRLYLNGESMDGEVLQSMISSLA